MTTARESDTEGLLRALGVDVWRLRRPGGTMPAAGITPATGTMPAAEPSPAGEPPTPRQVTEAGLEAVRAVIAETEPAPVAARAAGRDRPATRNPERPGPPPAEGVAAFTVVSFSKPGASLMVVGDPGRALRRFAADLLSAATGCWGGQTASLVFRWPQPGIDNTPSTLSRALGAFVARQLSENGDGLCMVGEDLLAHLERERLPEGCLVLPGMDALMSDPGMKRALWKDIQCHLDR